MSGEPTVGGWSGVEKRVVLAAFLCLVLIAGWTNYSLPLYLAELTARGIPLSHAAAGTSVLFVAGALGSLPVGRALARVEPRMMVLAGGLVGGLSVAGIGQVHAEVPALLCYAGMGLAFIALGTLPLTTAVVRVTTPRSRPGALALSTIGISAGGVLAAPVLSWLSGRWGAGPAAVLCGVVLFVVVTATALWLMPRAPVLVGPEAASASPGRATHYLRRRSFWLLGAAFAVYLTAQIGSLTHIVRLGNEHGLPVAGVLVPTVTAAAVLARFATTAALKVIPLWRWTWLVFVAQAVALSVLAATTGVAGALSGAVLLGFAVGCTPLLMPLTQIDAFGSIDFPRISAGLGIFAALGQAVGPVLLAVVHDADAGYGTAYLLAAALSLFGAVLAGLTGQLVRSRNAAQS